MLEQLQSVPPWLVVVVALAVFVVAIGAVGMIGRGLHAVQTLLQGPLSRA